MDLKGILSIAGQGGLFKMISQGKNAVIVEHMDTGNRMPAYATARISGLEDISIYTMEDELPLKEVLEKIMDKEENKEIASPKKMSNTDLKSYFSSIIPNYDTDRVYVSDMKKVLVWYNDLLKHGLLEKEPEPEESKEIEDKAPEETGTEDK
jgi:hypothetical protein